MKTLGKQHGSRSALLLVALMAGVLAIGPGCDLSGSSTGYGRDASHNSFGEEDTGGFNDFDAGSGDDTNGSSGDPSIESQVFEGPGIYSFFDGEVVLELPTASLEKIRVTVEKARLPYFGDEVVGYIWGPHGIPIDPPAIVDVELPISDFPGVEPKNLRLLLGTGNSYSVLDQGEPVITGSRVRFRAAMPVLQRLIVAVPVTPAEP